MKRYLVLTVAILQGCCPVTHSVPTNYKDLKQIGLVENIKIDLMDSVEIGITKNINCLVFQRNITQVTYFVASRQLIIKPPPDFEKGQLRSQKIYEKFEEGYVRTEDLLKLMHKWVCPIREKNGHGFAFYDKRIHITRVINNEMEMENFQVKMEQPFEALWAEIKELRVPGPECD